MIAPLRLAAAAGWLCLVAGCVNLGRTAPETIRFAFDVRRPQPGRESPLAGHLRVEDIVVSPRFRGRKLVYRLDRYRFDVDFYREFLIPPGELVAEAASSWLAASGLFARVTHAPGDDPDGFVLSGAIDALYGDYRTPKAPEAVLGLSLRVDRLRNGNPETVAAYRADIRKPLADTYATSLVDGWNAALGTALEEFEQHLTRTLGETRLTSRE